jgi:hypothetical protein
VGPDYQVHVLEEDAVWATGRWLCRSVRTTRFKPRIMAPLVGGPVRRLVDEVMDFTVDAVAPDADREARLAGERRPTPGSESTVLRS